MPPAAEPLEPEKVIDISHESLMRVWERLRRWAEDEANSARRYRRFTETAALEKTGKARLWRDPDLQLALDWQEEQAPTPTWANLYGGDFESATAFLEKSRSERDYELAHVVFERRWSRRRLVIILLIAGVFLWRLALGDFEYWSDNFGYKRNVNAPVPPAGALAPTQGLQERLEAVGYYGRNSVQNAARLLGALTCLLGPYLLGYVVLAYSGKWVFRRFAFAKILHEVALSSSKAVREQKLEEQALPPLDSKRSIVKLILLAIVWMLVFWVSSLLLAGALAGFLNPKNAREGRRESRRITQRTVLVDCSRSIYLAYCSGKTARNKKDSGCEGRTPGSGGAGTGRSRLYVRSIRSGA